MCGISQGFAVCCRWLLLGILLSGIVMSCMTLTSCHFVKYTDGTGTDGAVGLYRYFDTKGGSCIDHPDTLDYNESAKAARMGGVVAPMAAFVALFIILMEFCCCRFVCSRLFIGIALLAALILQGLTFLLFGSEQFCNADIINEILHQVPCSINEGAVFSIVAMVLYFLSGVIVFCTPKPEPMMARKNHIETNSSHVTPTEQQQQSWPPSIEEIETPAERKSAAWT